MLSKKDPLLRQELEQRLKALDAEIEKLAVPQQKPQPENAYTKCVQQLKVAKYQRDWQLKEVERVHKELEDMRRTLELQELVAKATQEAVEQAYQELGKQAAKGGPGHVRYPPEPQVVAAAPREVIVDLCAKLQAGLFGFCDDPDAQCSKYVEAWDMQGKKSAGPMETPASWALKKVAEYLMELVETERPQNKTRAGE